MKLDFYVLGARRTPVGTFLGSLKNVGPVELGVFAAKAALEDVSIPSEDFSHSIFGNVCSVSSPDGAYVSRHIALRAGLPIGIGAVTVNRLCGSGFEAIAQAAPYVSEGPVLVGGAENMSLMPLLMRNSREGWKFTRPPASIDSLWEALNDTYAGMPMAATAENLAKEFSITREECDQWALLSHQRAAAAESEGLFKTEIVEIDLGGGKSFSHDEHIRKDTSLEKLSKLKPAFGGGVTTAGNASGMNDAAAVLVVASESYTREWMKRSGKKPLAHVVGVRAVGCDPHRMGIGPVGAIQQLLSELRWTMKDVDYLEINEAFAAQILAVKKALKLSDDQLNPHGSGISIGHPLGATGARISAHISHGLGQGRARKAIGAACIGGGQGIALAFEKSEI